jgi:hypothetical protein
VEETILLDFTIQEAGVREVTFWLPESMRDARISAPLLRQKTIEPVKDGAETRVRVRLALQDEVMNNFRVLVENDRLLTSEKFSAPIPQVESGETDHRYVTLESAGRDEVIVDASEGIDPLIQEQAEWRMLSEMLGRGLTQAYLVRSAATEPKLDLRARDRAAVDTAGARIGLAKATLVIDPNGAYRGAQLYRVDNSLEQYLEIQLPEGARLWTAHVAGEPVKPAATTTAGTARIPLVKTAAGDSDYAVVLKYGGQLGQLGVVDRVEFPFIRTRNINVELSQVELYVPATHQWFNFGGTMRVVSSKGDLVAGELAYATNQIRQLGMAIRGEDEYARARALYNYKILQDQSESLRQSAGWYGTNDELEKQIETNALSVEGIQREIERGGDRSGVYISNRGRLNERFSEQSIERSTDVVQQAGENFDGQISPNFSQPLVQGAGVNKDWLRKNKLEGDTKVDTGLRPQAKTPVQKPTSQPTPQADFSKLAGQGGNQQARDSRPSRSSGEKSQQNLERYQKRLGQPQQQLPQSANASAPVVMDQSDSMDIPGDRAGRVSGGMGEGLGGGAPNQSVAAQSGKSVAVASLDVELQPRGIKYLLTTPRGNVQVTAQAVSSSLAGRLVRLLAIAFVAAIVLWLMNRVIQKRSRIAPAV